jgi:hypothetical protein
MAWIGIVAGLLVSPAACARELSPPGPVLGPADGEIETSVFLIGDAGEPGQPREPVLEALAREIGRDPEKSLVLILGDNIYPEGLDSLPGSVRRRDQEPRLTRQLDILLEARVRGVVVPGNHDWARHKRGGLASVKAQELFVDEYVSRSEAAKSFAEHSGGPLIEFLPKGGCPGPAVRDVGEHLRVLVLDTQWWLHPYAKPGIDECKEDETGFVGSLRAAIEGAGRRRTIVVAHHPIETASEHGGFYDWKHHVFPLTAFKHSLWVPLPLLGSFYPLARSHGFTPQDVSSIQYCGLLAALDSAFGSAPPLLYAAGHDHGLQMFKGGLTPYSIVSGGGRYEKVSPVTRRANSLFARAAAGFMRLDIMADDSPPRLGVHVVDGSGQSREAFALRLEPVDGPRAAAPRCREQPGPPAMGIQVPGREY